MINGRLYGLPLEVRLRWYGHIGGILSMVDFRR